MLPCRRFLRTLVSLQGELVAADGKISLSWAGFQPSGRSLAKGSQKQTKQTKKKKQSPKSKKTAPVPKITDPKIEPKMQRCLELLKPTPEVVQKTVSEEELKELEYAKERAKEYSRRKMRQHRKWQSDMAMKERIARDAIRALPPELREEAVKRDTSVIPMRLPFPTDTPPREWA